MDGCGTQTLENTHFSINICIPMEFNMLRPIIMSQKTSISAAKLKMHYSVRPTWNSASTLHTVLWDIKSLGYSLHCKCWHFGLVLRKGWPFGTTGVPGCWDSGWCRGKKLKRCFPSLLCLTDVAVSWRVEAISFLCQTTGRTLTTERQNCLENLQKHFTLIVQ